MYKEHRRWPMFVHSRIEPQVVIATTENAGHTVADLRCHGVRVVFKIEYDLIHCPLRSRHPSHNPANANNSPSLTSKQNGCLAVRVRWPSRGPTLLLVSTGWPGRLPAPAPTKRSVQISRTTLFRCW